MSWLDDLRSAALVGTGRHVVPSPSAGLSARPPEGLSGEESLLHQAAMADVATRASRRAPVPGGTLPEPAPLDPIPAAPEEAARLLDLLLNQSPVGQELRWQLVVDWLRCAGNARRRVPHRLLPALFTLADAKPAVRERLEPAIGARGLWLRRLQNKEPLVPAGPEWSTLAGADAAAAFELLRGTDPGAAREHLAAQWTSLSARERARMLALLSIRLHNDDEPLLEVALDDKAKSVREAAVGLLDGLAESARALRMAERLRPLVQFKGLLAKRFEVDLPGDPDTAAVRDGIAPHPPTGDPDGLGRLDTIIRGAPLDVWCAVSGRDVPGTLKLLKDEPRILGLLAASAARRGDLEWVRALLAVRLDTVLLDALPASEQAEHLTRFLRSGEHKVLAAVPLLTGTPRPWPRELADAVLDRITEKNGGLLAGMLAGVLPTALPPESAERCRAMLGRPDDDASRRRILRDAIQYQSFRQSVTEAFQ